MSDVLGGHGRSGQRHVVWLKELGLSRQQILWYNSQTALVYRRPAPSHLRRKPRRQCVPVRQCSVHGVNGAIGLLPVGMPREPEQYSEFWKLYATKIVFIIQLNLNLFYYTKTPFKKKSNYFSD